MDTVFHPQGYRCFTHTPVLQVVVPVSFPAISTPRNARARFFNFINSLTSVGLIRLLKTQPPLRPAAGAPLRGSPEQVGSPSRISGSLRSRYFEPAHTGRNASINRTSHATNKDKIEAPTGQGY